jgi:hypothetical protein
MSGNSFLYRVVLLVGLMLIISLVELKQKGAQAGKFREYGFVLAAGIIGALVGFVNDLITSSISPDYFILGKGLDEGANLRLEAGLFGLQVGFSAGVIGGATCLYACRRKTRYPPARYSTLFKMLWMPVLAAVAGGILLPLACSQFDPVRFATQLGSLLDAEKISRFRRVWWIHAGLYLGMIIGLVAMVRGALRERRVLGKEDDSL